MKRAGGLRRATWLGLSLTALVTRHLLLILLLLRLLVIASIVLLTRVRRRRLTGFARCHLALRCVEENLGETRLLRSSQRPFPLAARRKAAYVPRSHTSASFIR
jgi:hypothetical protein